MYDENKMGHGRRQRGPPQTDFSCLQEKFTRRSKVFIENNTHQHVTQGLDKLELNPLVQPTTRGRKTSVFVSDLIVHFSWSESRIMPL